MEENRQRCSVRSQNDDLANSSVKRLGGLVGTLLQLSVVRCLLNLATR